MKKQILFFILIAFFNFSFGQRYLNPVFTSVDSIPNISYGNALNIKGFPQSLLLDFYQPLGDTLSNRPLIIYIHGGGFSDTTQTRKLLHIKAFCDSFALRGYAVASIDYRLDSAATGLSNRAIINAMHDAKASIRFFKANAFTYRIDTAKVFIGGESAGGITALTASYINQTKEVFYPATPPLSLDNTIEGNSGNPGYSSKVKSTLSLCAGTRHISGFPVFDTSAIQSPSDPSLLIVNGTNDPIIPTAAFLDLFIRATNVGLPNLFYPLYGATHCPWFYPLPNSWAYLDTLVNYTSTFLYASLSTGIKKPIINNQILTFYPNPFSFSTTLETSILLKHATLIVYNLHGQNVKQINNISGQSISLYRDNLPIGIYFIRLIDENKKYYAGKIVITD